MKQLSLLGLILSFVFLGCTGTPVKHSVSPVDQMAASEKPAPMMDRHPASEQLFWIAHPCSIKGAPYRKYHSFALDLTSGKIWARATEAAAPKELPDLPNGRVAWDSVTHFFGDKGITAFCAANSGEVAPPTAPGNGGSQADRPVRPRPSPARPPGIPDRGDDEGQTYRPPATNFQAPVTRDTGLYYAPLFIVGDKPPVNADGSPKKMQQRVHEFLSRPHLQAAGQADRVVDACPAQVENGTVCVSQRIHDYAAARRHMFGDIDLRQTSDGSYEVFDYYCQTWKGPKEYAAAGITDPAKLPAPGRIPDHMLINCEHTWPQSKFIVKKKAASTDALKMEVNKQETDLNHLFPTDNKINATRGNWDFAEVNPQTAEKMSCSDGKFGDAVLQPGLTSEERAKYFEPPTEHKGNVARALFYFSSRYNMGMSSLQEFYLRKWHQQDPPDADEIARNEKVYMIMGVRNPYIDGPSLVSHIQRFCRVRLTANQAPTANDCP